MDSTSFNEHFRLTIKPSRIWFRAGHGIHGLALIAPWFAAIPGWLMVLLSALVIASWVDFSRRPQLEEQLIVSDGIWQRVVGRDLSDELLLIEWVVRTYLVVLLLKDPRGRRQRMIIWPDSLTTDEFRQLRVYLRFGVHTVSGLKENHRKI